MLEITELQRITVLCSCCAWHLPNKAKDMLHWSFMVDPKDCGLGLKPLFPSSPGTVCPTTGSVGLKNPPTPLWRWRRAYWGAIGYTKCSSHICLYSSRYISFSWGGGGPSKISHRNRSPAGVFVIFRTFFGVWIWRGYWDGILGRFGGILGLEKRRNRNKILCIGTFKRDLGCQSRKTHLHRARNWVVFACFLDDFCVLEV